MTPLRAEALRIFRELGGGRGAKAEAARRMGMDPANFSKMLALAEAEARQVEEQPEGITEVLDDIRVQGAGIVWYKTAPKDGKPGVSAMWRRPKPEADPLAFLDAIKAGLTDLPRAGAVEAPGGPADLMAVFPVADLHIGLLTDPEETGEAWDTGIAVRTFGPMFDRLASVTPDAGVAMLAQLGDLSHTTDQTNLTESGHQLDADTRFHLILRRSIAVMKGAIDTLRRRYPLVIYRGSRGNHDRWVHLAVTEALAEHYRDVPGVKIEASAHDIYVHQFGRNLIALHHGDKVKPDRLAHFLAAEFAETWGRTRHRIALSGHIHHARAQEVGGLVCESVGTIIPRDAWARASGYTARRALVSITLHRDEGEVSRARVGVS